MLRHLHIRNFAIVDDLELEFADGMTILTGETGAGKSILLDALGLTLGDRADSTVVRHGSERAEISASFEVDALPAVAAWLQERELEADGECLIRRTVGADGRSRGYVNGQPMPVQALRELGEQLVDIHGQHAHQYLLRRGTQRELLDDYADHGELLHRTANAFRHWRALADELARLQKAAEERDARLDLLRYQVGELETLDLSTDELETLEEEHNRLAHASRLLEGCQGAVQSLYEGEESAVADRLNHTLAELQELREFDSALGPSVDLLEAAAIQVKEAATELRHYLSALELDPQRLAWVEQRLADIQDLARKHRVEPLALPPLLETLREELEALEQADARRGNLQGEIDAAETDYLKLAAQLTKGRQAAAKKLSAQVSENMQGLGMQGGRFEAQLSPRETGDYSATGLDQVAFLVSANPGQPLRPLNKVASGGELSRISLAIQVIVAGKGRIPTLIFDEVDVGVGGGVAEMVGRRLRALGEEAQVFCVTHQPQVAALGHHHLQIRKLSTAKTTRTEVRPLEQEQRVEEVARMLGGMEITEQTLAHAREMLSLAGGNPEKPKKRRKA